MDVIDNMDSNSARKPNLKRDYLEREVPDFASEFNVDVDGASKNNNQNNTGLHFNVNYVGNNDIFDTF